MKEVIRTESEKTMPMAKAVNGMRLLEMKAKTLAIMEMKMNGSKITIDLLKKFN